MLPGDSAPLWYSPPARRVGRVRTAMISHLLEDPESEPTLAELIDGYLVRIADEDREEDQQSAENFRR